MSQICSLKTLIDKAPIIITSYKCRETGADPQGVQWVPFVLNKKIFFLGIKSKNASSLLLCLPI